MVALETLDERMKVLLSPIAQGQALIPISKWVKYHGLMYEQGAVVVTGSDNELEFNEIHEVLYLHGQIYFIANALITDHFASHFHAYALKRTSVIKLINQKNLKSIFPLQMYETEGQLNFVSLMHFFPVQEESNL